MRQSVVMTVREHLRANDALQEPIEWAEIAERSHEGVTVELSQPAYLLRRVNSRPTRKPGLVFAMAGLLIVLVVGVPVWLLSSSGGVEDRGSSSLSPYESRESIETAQMLLESRVEMIESLLDAYNAGDFNDWLTRFSAVPELGNGLDADSEAAFMAAGGLWVLDGACSPRQNTVVCATFRSDDFFGAAGLDRRVFFAFFFASGSTDLIGYEGESGPSDVFEDHWIFIDAFRSWLGDVHPEIDSGFADESHPWIASADMPTALQYVEEFVAQSDIYPPASTD